MTAHRRVRTCVLECARRRIVLRAALAIGVLGVQQSAAREVSDAAGDRFFSPYYGCEVEFERDDTGAVRSMVYLLTGGGSLRLSRQ